MATTKRKKPSKKMAPDAQELFVLELQEIHSAENQLSRVLPRLAKAVQSETLKECIEAREKECERILSDLEEAFDRQDESPGRRKNLAAEGLINDLREHAQEIERGPALDAVVLAGLQKTEHYCIAAWGTARSQAEALEEEETVKAMERALKEGRATDGRLTELAETEIMPALMSGEEDEEEEEGGEDRRGRRGAERHANP